MFVDKAVERGLTLVNSLKVLTLLLIYVKVKLKRAHSRLENSARARLNTAEHKAWLYRAWSCRIKLHHVKFTALLLNILPQIFFFGQEPVLLILLDLYREGKELLSKGYLKLHVLVDAGVVQLERTHKVVIQLLVLCNHIISVFLILKLQLDVPKERIGEQIITDGARDQELAERGGLKTFISIGLHELQHNAVDLLRSLLLQALDSDGSDLVEPGKLIGKGGALRQIDPICCEHE